MFAPGFSAHDLGFGLFSIGIFSLDTVFVTVRLSGEFSGRVYFNPNSVANSMDF